MTSIRTQILEKALDYAGGNRNNPEYAGYLDGAAAMRLLMLEAMEEWCGMDAYEHGFDKATDEHSCDDCRGVNCSAMELTDYITKASTLTDPTTDKEGRDV
jgi:hypothetical protein